ncbi:hypothetical protein YC2023_009863 [Brassica napus]
MWDLLSNIPRASTGASLLHQATTRDSLLHRSTTACRSYSSSSSHYLLLVTDQKRKSVERLVAVIDTNSSREFHIEKVLPVHS